MFSTTAGFWRHIAVVGRWDQQSPPHPLFFSYIPHHHIPLCLYISLGFVVCPSYTTLRTGQRQLDRPMPHPRPSVAHHLHPRIISMRVAYPQKRRRMYLYMMLLSCRDTLHYNHYSIYLLGYIVLPAHLICIETRKRFFSVDKDVFLCTPL